MDQRRRLEGVAGGFLGHARRRQLAQLLIDQRQQLFQRPLLTATQGLQYKVTSLMK